MSYESEKEIKEDLFLDDIRKDMDSYGVSKIERKFIALFVIIAFVLMMSFCSVWYFVTLQPGKIRSFCRDLPLTICKMWNI